MVSLRSIIHCSPYHWTYTSKIATLQYWVYTDLCSLYRSTPVEVLHTILLEPYKYLTREVMSHLSSRQREKVKAKMKAFSYSGIKGRVYGDVTKYCGSFVGRDFKAWAQIAPFIIGPYLSSDEFSVWLLLTMVKSCGHNKHTVCCCKMWVFKMAYTEHYHPDQKGECEEICKNL